MEPWADWDGQGGREGGYTEGIREQGEEVRQETQSALFRLPRLPACWCSFA